MPLPAAASLLDLHSDIGNQHLFNLFPRVLDFATAVSHYLHGFVSSGMWEFYNFSLNSLQAHSKVYNKACRKHMFSILPSQHLRKLDRPNLVSLGVQWAVGISKGSGTLFEGRKSIQEASFSLLGGILQCSPLCLLRMKKWLGQGKQSCMGKSLYSLTPLCVDFNLNCLRFTVYHG